MSEFELPRNLVREVQAHDDPRSARRAWVADLPLIVDKLALRWSLDRPYDPLQHMLNFPDRLTRDPTGFTQRMADLLGLDAERLRRWLFARCVQESVDQPHLQSAAIELAP